MENMPMAPAAAWLSEILPPLEAMATLNARVRTQIKTAASFVKWKEKAKAATVHPVLCKQ